MLRSKQSTMTKMQKKRPNQGWGREEMAVEIPSRRARESNMLFQENLALNKEMFSEHPYSVNLSPPPPLAREWRSWTLHFHNYERSLFQLCHNPWCFDPNLTVSCTYHRYYRLSQKTHFQNCQHSQPPVDLMVGNWQSSANWWQARKCIFWDTLYNWVTSIYFCFNTKLNWRVCTMGFRAGQYNRICLLNSDRLEPTQQTVPLVWTKKLTLGSLSTLFSQKAGY